MMKKTSLFCLRLLVCLLALTMLPLFSLSSSAAAEFVKDTEYVIDDVEVELLFKMDQHYEGHVVQGMAVHNGIVFQLHDGGRCSTYDLRTGTKLGEFHLGSFYDHNHCGNGNFGWIYPEGNTEFPALYVSGDLTTKACYVENVTATSAELIQTIYFDIDPSYTAGQIILDRERNRIVYMQREKSSIGSHSNVYRMCEFPIPALDAGEEIHFTNDDMLCEPYVLPFYPGIYQGACIYGNTILQTHGYSSTPTEYGAKVGMVLYDTVTHDFTRAFDLTGIIDVEPQGTFVYEGRLYMNFVDGRLYEIKPKPKQPIPSEGYEVPCVDDFEHFDEALARVIPAPYRLKELHEITNVTAEGAFAVDVTLQTPYNDVRMTIFGTFFGHDFGEAVYNNDATCTQNGTKSAVCQREGCGFVDTVEAIGSALGHCFGEFTANGDATCTENGTQTRHCTFADCRHTETVENPDSALGHRFEEWEVTQNASARENGSMESSCARCGAKQTVILNAYGLGTVEITVIAVASVVALITAALAVVLLVLIRKNKKK